MSETLKEPKVQFFKNGALQGWVISTVFTIMTMTFLGLGFFIPKVADAWVKIGGIYQTVYLGSMGIWFVYHGAKAFSGGGINVSGS